MAHIKKIIILLLLIFPNLTFSQCLNSNFELGNFTNWSGRRGTCCPINLPTNGILNGRQTIMTQGIDPHSCGGLNMVYQGNFSARLGNDAVGARAEGLYYQFTVSPNSTLIQYAYAVVLQDPGHNDGDQPRFQSRVRLQNGNVIPCTEYMVTAGPNLSGYNYCTEIDSQGNLVQVAWSDWRVITLDLSGYIGQVVTLEFETGDCELGAHYGYAYIDAISCGPIETQVSYCLDSDSILVEGPEGFATYEWVPTGDTTRVITIGPQDYDTLWCNVTTVTGCELQLEVLLNPVGVLAEIICDNTCIGDTVYFTNLTPLINGYNLLFYWDFGDGQNSIEYSPSHFYELPGAYIVTLTVEVEGTNCTDITYCEVIIYEEPIPINEIEHD